MITIAAISSASSPPIAAAASPPDSSSPAPQPVPYTAHEHWRASPCAHLPPAPIAHGSNSSASSPTRRYLPVHSSADTSAHEPSPIDSRLRRSLQTTDPAVRVYSGAGGGGGTAARRWCGRHFQPSNPSPALEHPAMHRANGGCSAGSLR